jgi:hypothetical protein
MFDDLRDSNQPMFEGEQVNKPEPVLTAPKRPGVAKKKNKKILGMTAAQRFVVATLLFLVICLVGAAVLVLTGKVALPL